MREIIKMGDYESGKSFYQSTSANTYHGLLIHSEWLVFLEITKGPFISEKTIFASWSPEKSEQNIGLQFIRDQYL